MKTLKKLMSVVLLLGAILSASAKDNYVKSHKEIPYQEIRTSILNYIKSDFAREHNYFYDNNISKFKGEVEIKFYITSDQKIQLLNADGQDVVAIEYVKQLLDDAKINVPDEYQNRKFKINLRLDYRT